jgi:hypothetical protein
VLKIGIHFDVEATYSSALPWDDKNKMKEMGKEMSEWAI